MKQRIALILAVLAIAAIAMIIGGANNPEDRRDAEIARLDSEIAALKERFAAREGLNAQDGPFRDSIERVADDFLPNKVFDLQWKKLFHYITFFESLDGFGNDDGAGGAGATLDSGGTQITFTTGAVSGNLIRVYKQPNNQGLITFSQLSRMRTGFQVAQITDQTAYLMVGNDISQGYGFKIVNGELFGVTRSAAAETTVKLQNINANERYNVEARYYPNERVVFYADDVTTTPDTLIRIVGVSTTTLPSAAATENTLLMFAKLTTNANAAKIMRMTFFEYLQFRNFLE